MTWRTRGRDRAIPREGRVERLPRDLANRHALLGWVADRVLVVGERVGEREFTRRLAELAADPLLVRRELVDREFVSRTIDGAAYWRA